MQRTRWPTAVNPGIALVLVAPPANGWVFALALGGGSYAGVRIIRRLA